MEEKSIGRKRPDVVERIKARKGKQETVIKCAFSKRLIEKSLMEEIQRWVHITSKVTNKSSLVFNRLLLYCLNNNIKLPDLTDQTLYLQCFNIGVGRFYKKIEVLNDVWETYFTDFPEIKKNRGDTQAYVYASKQYMTNFKNSLIFTFKNRQKAYLIKWCSVNNITEKGAYHSIQCAINGGGCLINQSGIASGHRWQYDCLVIGNANIVENGGCTGVSSAEKDLVFDVAVIIMSRPDTGTT